MTRALMVAPGVDTLVVDGEVLVFDGTMIHLMSGSGVDIWHAADGRRSRDQIISELAGRHPSVEAVAADVAAYVDDLVERGLLMESESRPEDGFNTCEHVGWTTDGDLVVVLDLRTGARQTLSATASRAWLHLADGLSRDAMVTRLGEEFPDAPASFVSELEALVDTLCAQGLLCPSASR